MGVVCYAASRDAPEVNKEFAEWTGCGVPILCDVAGDVAQAYGVIDETRPTPARMTFYIDTKGRIAHVDREVSPTSHGADIVQQARALRLLPAARISRMSKRLRRLTARRSVTVRA